MKNFRLTFTKKYGLYVSKTLKNIIVFLISWWKRKVYSSFKNPIYKCYASSTYFWYNTVLRSHQSFKIISKADTNRANNIFKTSPTSYGVTLSVSHALWISETSESEFWNILENSTETVWNVSSQSREADLFGLDLDGKHRVCC